MSYSSILAWIVVTCLCGSTTAYRDYVDLMQPRLGYYSGMVAPAPPSTNSPYRSSYRRTDVSCQPDLFPRLVSPGFCLSTYELNDRCVDREISYSKNCYSFDGNWCCYFPPAMGNPQRPPGVIKTEEPERFQPGQFAKLNSMSNPAPSFTLPVPAPPELAPGLFQKPLPIFKQSPSSFIQQPPPPFIQQAPAPVPQPPSAPQFQPPAPPAFQQPQFFSQPEVGPSPPVMNFPPAQPLLPPAPRTPVLGQSCANVNQCPDSGTTCRNGRCDCWTNQGFSVAQTWSCTVGLSNCGILFPGHVCRPSTICRHLPGANGYCTPLSATQ